MPSEMRILRFRLEEVTQAIRNLASRIDIKVPEDDLTQIHASPDGAQKVLLKYGEEGTSVVISNAQLAVCLISYCVNTLNLPMCREATKAIDIARGNVDLRIAHTDAVRAQSVQSGQHGDRMFN